MIETFCKDCGQRYPLGQGHECTKRSPKKSTAARKVPTVHKNPVAHEPERPAKTTGTDERLKGNVRRPKGVPANVASMSERTAVRVPAGSHSGEFAPDQATPVDPNHFLTEDLAWQAPILTKAEAAAAHLASKRSGGRPKKHEDRKAYRAQKAREYRKRDKLKEGPRDA